MRVRHGEDTPYERFCPGVLVKAWERRKCRDHVSLLDRVRLARRRTQIEIAAARVCRHQRPGSCDRQRQQTLAHGYRIRATHRAITHRHITDGRPCSGRGDCYGISYGNGRIDWRRVGSIRSDGRRRVGWVHRMRLARRCAGVEITVARVRRHQRLVASCRERQ
jgi:hypothetical protein